MKCPICNKPMKEQTDGTCISYQETNCICNIAAPKLIWKEMAVLRDKKNIFTQSMRIEKEFAEEECKRIQTELERTRKALEWARHFLIEIRLRYLLEKDNPSRQNKWADTALYMYNCAESFFDDYDKTALEQKEVK